VPSIFRLFRVLSPTGYASRYPCPKCLVYSEKTPSNRVDKGRTYFASKVRGNSNLRLSLSSTQICVVDHGGTVGDRVGGAGVGRPADDDGEAGPQRGAAGPARRDRGGARLALLGGPVDDDDESGRVMPATGSGRRGKARRIRGGARLARRGGSVVGRSQLGARRGGKRAAHVGICSAALLLGLLLENGRFRCMTLFSCVTQTNECISYLGEGCWRQS
jgi:hypothetical protein